MSTPISCLFLHSSTDKPVVNALVGLARQDPPCDGFQSWLDSHDMDSDQATDRNVSAQIAAARAIVFCIGRDGLGPYQRAHEAPQIKRRLEVDQSPLRLIPLLLPGGMKAAVPDWMQSWSVLNWDRGESSDQGLWRLLRQRLATPPMDNTETQLGQPRLTNLSPSARGVCAALSGAVRETKTFSVLLGPYDQDLSTIGGPDRLSAEMLKIIGWSPLDGQVIPWPTEAATWAVIGETRTRLVNYLNETLQRPDSVAPDTSTSIAQFAKEFQAKSTSLNHGPGNQDRPWRLQILTTHLDDTLENALIREAGAFFRIIPTARPERRVEIWQPGLQREATRRVYKKTPKKLAGLDLMELRQDSGLANVDIFVVKLCGVLDESDSLTISTADFFRTWQQLMDLPTRITTDLRKSALLLLGSGQSSTLGAMIRSVLLPNPDSQLDKNRRFWVTAEDPVDRLSRLEDHFIDMQASRQEFCDMMQIKDVARASPSIFIRNLMDML